MTSAFENLCAAGGPLKREAPDATAFAELLRLGRTRLNDAQITGLSLEGRFDLAYNAAHALCFAALRWHGYRSAKRYIVFQLLPHTLGLGPEVWRVLAMCHDIRNRGEYQGKPRIDARIVDDLIAACSAVSAKVEGLSPPASEA
jgi:hypothetical protein